MLPEETVFCNACGEGVTVYTPPAGFEYEPDLQLFYRTELADDGVKWITWFDANAGTYEQVSYHDESQAYEQTPEPETIQQAELMPEYEFVTEPEPEPEPEPEHILSWEAAPLQPQIEVPEGFTLDQSSGMYYKAMPGRDSTGAMGQWYTWFYPDTGEFQQQFHAD